MPVSHRFASVCILFVLFLPIAGLSSDQPTLPKPVVDALLRHKLSAENLSVYVRELGSGEEIVSHKAEIARNPASTMKLVTGLAALELLTPTYRWKTRVFAAAEPIDGVIDGDLFIVGAGDPYLVEERLYLLLSTLHRKGVRHVTGDLVIDDSLFAPITEDTGEFDGQPFRVYNATPSAVLSNFNSTRFEFRPNGKGVDILPTPALPGLRIRNQLSLQQNRCRGYRRGVSMTAEASGVIVFDGRFPTRCNSYAFTRSVMEPWRYTAELLQQVWGRLGGQIDGKLRRGVLASDQTQLLEFDSLSLAEVVRLMNKHSSNLVARQLVLTLAHEHAGAPATEKAGISLLYSWLENAGIMTDELVIENGAGRSRKARLSARNLVDLIDYSYKSRFMPEFLASLPILGQDGTLSDRQNDTALSGQAHMKTGSLDHVAALAGVFQGKNGRRFAVAVLHNEENSHRGGGAAVQDSLLKWLGSQNSALAAR